MSVEIARYQFHSWARKGISSNITEADDLGAGTSSGKERAEIAVPVALNEAGMTKNFMLIGPGDIIGINRDMIVRTEPLNWITDFESNYLAFLEFYDEDFAWRYTPARPQGAKLRPWIFLLILKEEEFERTKRTVPLPTIIVKSTDAFPPANETSLWAHMHSNADIPNSELSDYEKFLLSLNKTLEEDPDQVYCRLVSPRKLEPNTPYCAFVIPAFETGRLAGLEQPTETINAQAPSWDNTNGAKGEMPFYFEWYFRTGLNADFESLVKLLEPRPMDPKVGIRDMDCSRPGFVRADDETLEIPGTKPAIIGLEGALKSPSTVSTVFPDPVLPNEFQPELQKIVNLPATIIGTDDSGDPIISVPLYGGKHAKKSEKDVVLLDVTSNYWVNDLNRDPRTRVPAGFGTRVIQKNQENYMRKAWAQVQKIIDANRKIKHTVLYMKVALQFTQKTFSQVSPTHLLAMSRPVLGRIMGSPTTILHQVQESRLPTAVLSGAFRRMVRPNGKMVKKLAVEKTFSYHQLVNDINDGKITAAPPKVTPSGLPNTKQIADKIFPYKLPGWILWLLKHAGLALIILLVIFLFLVVVTGLFFVVGALATLVVAAYVFTSKLRTNYQAAEILVDPEKELELISNIPQRPSFTLKLSDESVTPPATSSGSGQDSVEAKNYRTALTDLTQRLAVKAVLQPTLQLNISNAYAKTAQAIHPHVSYPLRLSSLVLFPGRIRLNTPETIFPAIAYPDFEDPMYKKLSDISSELLLPNLKLIPPNTISLLETNQKFIESYMVGLNHEMGRELLWREYPTDERGSYFRQFWDVNGIIKPEENKSDAELTEEHKDIKPIHTWPFKSELGRHNNRDAQGDAKQLVLVIRGDLLKRYPNTVIFAQKAITGKDPNEPEIDQDLSAEEFKTHVMFPLYKAEIEPDIKFFGFDLTKEQAEGTDPSPGFTDKLGWFFIIQEIPGEPRFGMDITFNQGSDGLSWDDLSWTKLPDSLKFIQASVVPGFNPPEAFRWGMDSANMAFILLQKPSMVAVHAKEMLEKAK
ncbi:MAG TPA: hypothetical protein VK589_26790 [Chryseolinea sp.]|nr:hypothetical protein [Chryseolinea sp.]